MKQLAVAVSILSLATSTAVAQAKDSDAGIKWSVAAGLNQPVGDLSNTSKLGFGAALGAEWAMSPAWGFRLDLSYTTFAGKSIATPFGNFPMPSINLIGVGANFVHRDESKLYYSIGAGMHNIGCSGCTSETKPSAQAALGWMLDDAKRFGLEAGLTNVFGSGSNATWVPIGVRIKF